MTVKQALEHLLESQPFLEGVKTDPVLRTFRSRYFKRSKKGLGMEWTINMLEKFGYTVEVKKKR